jgi:quinol monooxygenase YgiN
MMSKFALYVPLEAKPGKEKEVADFLRSAVPLVDAEAGTISWFAIQMGPSSFAIFDTFDDEAGRNAHLNGKVAAALMEKAKSGGPIHRKVTCPSSASYGWSHGELCIGHFQFAAKSILLQFKIPRSLDCPDANRIGDL